MYNEEAAKELNRLQNERINLTEENLSVFRALLDGEFSYIMDLILDKSSHGLETGVENFMEFLGKTKDGGLLQGFSHSQGGMRIMSSNVEVEGGEYVVNKQSTRKNLGLLEYINGERRGLGYSDMNTFFGQTPSTSSFLTQMMNEPSVVPQLPIKDSVDSQILSAIERINFQPRVSVTDINTVHDNMVKVDEWTGL